MAIKISKLRKRLVDYAIAEALLKKSQALLQDNAATMDEGAIDTEQMASDLVSIIVDLRKIMSRDRSTVASVNVVPPGERALLQDFDVDDEPLL